jgi:PiT family inorganic phosphate transporter
MGLIVLILVGIVPAAFALNLGTSADALHQLGTASSDFSALLEHGPGAQAPAVDADTAHKQLTQYLRTGRIGPDTVPALAVVNARVSSRLVHLDDLSALPPTERRALRLDVYLMSESLTRMQKAKTLPAGLDGRIAEGYTKSLKGLTNFIPVWVKVAIALALGLGTMIGWKRIVVTVGEKIGKAHLTYGQGAAAELVAFGTIEAADVLGLPVSTTHILSSGIAGTMVANGSGIQRETVRNILLAWVLTLPVCVILGAALFGAALFFVLRILGVH